MLRSADVVEVIPGYDPLERPRCMPLASRTDKASLVVLQRLDARRRQDNGKLG
jgi:hypothetical protein